MNNDKVKINKEEFKETFKKRLYKFILELVKFIDSLDKRDPTCRVISEQLIDSGTGMLSNYLEALVGSSKKDFANYFRYCLKCCNESKMWVAVLRDSRKADLEKSKVLLKEMEEFGNIFASSLITLKRSRTL